MENTPRPDKIHMRIFAFESFTCAAKSGGADEHLVEKLLDHNRIVKGGAGEKE